MVGSIARSASPSCAGGALRGMATPPPANTNKRGNEMDNGTIDQTEFGQCDYCDGAYVLGSDDHNPETGCHYECERSALPVHDIQNRVTSWLEQHEVCPRCLTFPINYEGRYGKALSRTDNKSYVCSDCGVAEALEQFEFGAPQGQEHWVPARALNDPEVLGWYTHVQRLHGEVV